MSHGWVVDLARTITRAVAQVRGCSGRSCISSRLKHLYSRWYPMKCFAVAFDCGENSDRLQQLTRRYEVHKPDLVGLCRVRRSELFPRHTLVTADESDFRVQRRNKPEAILGLVLCMHKSAPYKISSVHIAFARRSVTAGAMRLTHMLRNSLLINKLAPCWSISTVGMHRALVQCERGLGPSPNG